MSKTKTELVTENARLQHRLATLTPIGTQMSEAAALLVYRGSPPDRHDEEILIGLARQWDKAVRDA